MDVFTFEVSRVGVRFSGGVFDGHFFSKGESILVQGQKAVFVGEVPTIHPEAIESGFWLLFRTTFRGFPAVVCRFFNRRTRLLEERYFKVFYREGVYRCGPRYPKNVRRFRTQDPNTNPLKKAA